MSCRNTEQYRICVDLLKYPVDIVNNTHCTVCSETNAQGEITFIRIVFKTPLFQDNFSPYHCRFSVAIQTDLSQQSTHCRTVGADSSLRWCVRPHQSSSWCSLGTTRCQSAPSLLSDTETRLQGWYQANRAGCVSSFRFSISVDCGIVPEQKPVLGWQSKTLQLENWLGLGQSILDVGYVDSFAFRLS